MKAITSILIRNQANQVILRSIPFSISYALCKKSLYNFSIMKQNASSGMNYAGNHSIKDQGDRQQRENKKALLTDYIECKKTLKILQEKGIQQFFPIQIQTYEHIYNGKDILASDRTGSGKTIAYSLPVIQKLRTNKVFGRSKFAKFVVFCPTRQLVIQVQKQIASLKHFDEDFSILTVYGGSSMERQINFIRNGVDIIVATPGRFIDLVQRDVIKLHDIVATCIDEADQMLQKGFKQEIQNIYQKIAKQVNQKPQNLMFSATLPDWVAQISRRYLSDDKIRINLIKNSEQKTSMTVKHYAVQCSDSEKLQVVKSLIKAYNPRDRTIVFSQTKKEVIQLSHQFLPGEVSYLQGDMSQRERQINLQAFRNKKTKILIATDVASRGLDIEDVGLVVQLEPHRTTEPYIHRSGRTGRAGKSGISITLFNSQNVLDLINIQREAKVQIKVIKKPESSLLLEEWQTKMAATEGHLKKSKNQKVKCSHIDQLAERLLEYYEPKDLIKSLIQQCVGSRPNSKSLITKKTGKLTYVLEMKNDQQGDSEEVDKIAGLNFISEHQTQLNIQSVQSQTLNIIFDIPEENSQKMQALKKGLHAKKSSFNIRRALPQDIEMGKLSDYAKRGSQRRESNNNRYSNDSSKYGENLSNYGEKSSRYGESSSRFGESRRQNNYSQTQSRRYQQNPPIAVDPNARTAFLSRIPAQYDESDLTKSLNSNGILCASLKLIKKQSQNGPISFAFLKFESAQQLQEAVGKRVVTFQNGSRGFLKVNEQKSN